MAVKENEPGVWNTMFWTAVLVMVAVGGFFAWRYVHSVPEQQRAEQCRRSCVAMGAEYVDVTDYGCFCVDDGIPFLLDADQIGIDYE